MAGNALIIAGSTRQPALPRQLSHRELKLKERGSLHTHCSLVSGLVQLVAPAAAQSTVAGSSTGTSSSYDGVPAAQQEGATDRCPGPAGEAGHTCSAAACSLPLPPCLLPWLTQAMPLTAQEAELEGLLFGRDEEALEQLGREAAVYADGDDETAGGSLSDFLRSYAAGAAAAGGSDEDEEDQRPRDGGPLLYEDRQGAGGSDGEAAANAGRQQRRRRAVWEDPQDEHMRVNVAASSRLRKLRQAEDETELTGEAWVVVGAGQEMVGWVVARVLPLPLSICSSMCLHPVVEQRRRLQPAACRQLIASATPHAAALILPQASSTSVACVSSTTSSTLVLPGPPSSSGAARLAATARGRRAARSGCCSARGGCWPAAQLCRPPCWRQLSSRTLTRPTPARVPSSA